ncbi:ras-related protein Rab-18-B-like isoform X1 [Paramacrobiotus metropolitanus]|uniref:ras-related protein Rab-18-B-like isoform X1 n=1 Tax=Paramacrobiotus metropolitanus TaxID=2943436 RepID=UPI002446539A|nr:ras-related protein Rab-18-B-like isoform X1 [Paramacrobiotus metropolitanus]
MDTTPITTLKLLIIGESGVGKSSLLLRFTDDTFDPELAATIGVDFKVKSLNANGNVVKLAIWVNGCRELVESYLELLLIGFCLQDTAGQERFRTLTPSYYRGAQGVILVYDVTSKSSFQKLEMWLGEVDSYANKPGMVKMLVANKIDQRTERVITREDGLKFARKHSMLFIECSARTADGVVTAFEELVEKILQTPGLWEQNIAKGINLSEKAETDAPSGGCGGYCELV